MGDGRRQGGREEARSERGGGRLVREEAESHPEYHGVEGKWMYVLYYSFCLRSGVDLHPGEHISNVLASVQPNTN